MKKLRIAVDTSVISGIKDDEWSFESTMFFTIITMYPEKVLLIIPPTVQYELRKARGVVKEFYESLKKENNIMVDECSNILSYKTDEIVEYYEKAKTVLDNKKISIKPSDLVIYIESCMLKCDYLITFDEKHLIKRKKLLQNIAKQLALTPTKITYPSNILNKIFK